MWKYKNNETGIEYDYGCHSFRNLKALYVHSKDDYIEILSTKRYPGHIIEKRNYDKLRCVTVELTYKNLKTNEVKTVTLCTDYLYILHNDSEILLLTNQEVYKNYTYFRCYL